MTRSTTRRRSMLVGAIALTAAAVGAQAPASGAQAAITCPFGYVCLQPADTPSTMPILIKEGESRRFWGLKVSESANTTRLNYCVTSSPHNYALRPGQTVARHHVVHAVAPSNYCLT